MAKKPPTSVTIRLIMSGSADCFFLVSFQLREDARATPALPHRLSAAPACRRKCVFFSLDAVAKDIKEKTGGKLTAVVGPPIAIGEHIWDSAGRPGS